MAQDVGRHNSPSEPRLDVDVRHANYEPSTQNRDHAVVANEALAPFYWGVASGDPTTVSVVLWTRLAFDIDNRVFDVKWRVALDPAMTQIVQEGVHNTQESADYHVRVQVQQLNPGTTYYYDFEAFGKKSMVGRTRTLPASDARHVRIAVVSCSNYPSGYFNAYAAIAARNDIDAVIHLGDYIYEYNADSTSYGGNVGVRLGRSHEPTNETVTLADYRARYAQYRMDPDLQELHRQHPFIHVWDDHESANNSYAGGAGNHQPNEGPWNLRMAASKRVCLEWMPTLLRESDPIYRAFSFGDLVELLMIDTRLDGREKQIENLGPNASQASLDSLNNPARRMMSDTQFDWLTNSLRQSTATWNLIGNQVMFSPVVTNPIDTAYLFEAVGPLFSAFLRPQLPALGNLMTSGFAGDTWSNYPAQRDRMVNFLRNFDVPNLVIATGDFHSTYVFDVPYTRPGSSRPLAVEFLTPSITSPNFDESFTGIPTVAPIAPQLLETLSRTLRMNNPGLKQVDLVNHGYLILDFKPTEMQGDVYFVDTLLIRSRAERFAFGWRRSVNTDSLRRATAPAAGKAQQDAPAPPLPTTSVAMQRTPTVLAVSPNPASTLVTLTWSNPTDCSVHIDVINMAGAVRASFLDPFATAGIRSTIIDVTALPSGAYFLRLHGPDGQRVHPLVIQR